MRIAPITRRTALLAGSLACLAAPAFGQQGTYPSRPIKILVGTAAGSTTDAAARLYGQKLSEVLNVPVVIDNKPGAAHLLAVRGIQSAPPDGYTLMAAVGSTLAQGPALRKNLPYDPVKDFTLISLIASTPGAIYVHSSIPATTMPELVAYAKANPGKITYASGGHGSAGHLQGEFFKQRTGTNLVHVAFKSDPDAARDVSSGLVQVAFTSVRPALPLAASGKVRFLSITDSKRITQLPQVPTIAEAGVPGLEGLTPYSFLGLVGPAKLPASIVGQLNAAVNKVSAMPDVVSNMRESIMAEPTIATTSEFRQFIDKELVKWRELGKTMELKD